MIKIILGDILNCKEFVIVHQVNTLGIMGGGLALQIRNRYPDTYKRYNEVCKKYPSDYLMGRSLLTIEGTTTKDAKVISNIFGQRKIRSYEGEVCTESDKLLEGLKELRDWTASYGFDVAIPYEIGCGLGGGDWKYIYSEIKKIFSEDDDITIYCLTEDMFDKMIELEKELNEGKES